MRFAKARKMSKVLRLPPKMQLIFWKARTICDAWWNMLRYVVMSQSATPATQNGIFTTFEPFQNERLCTFPNRHGDAARKSENRDKTCWKPKIRISHGTSSNFLTWQLQNRRFLTSFPNEPQNWLPQNRCFVSGFHQFSSHVKKCQACNAICALLPLDAALTMQFAKKNTPATKIQIIFWKSRKSIAPVTQNDP
jgi:hypothetical protein